jgi:hypothetical protein
MSSQSGAAGFAVRRETTPLITIITWRGFRRGVSRRGPQQRGSFVEFIQSADAQLLEFLWTLEPGRLEVESPIVLKFNPSFGGHLLSIIRASV